jgi:predicted transcriptional regulator
MKKKQPAPSLPKRGGGRMVLKGSEAEISRAFMTVVIVAGRRFDLIKRKVYGPDLELASIAEHVGVGAGEAFMRDREVQKKFASYLDKIGVENQRGINALSISQATGIPRETVRRKLKKLLDEGVLLETTRGSYIMKPGFIQRPEVHELVEVSIRETMRMINDLVEAGLIEWVPEK